MYNIALSPYEKKFYTEFKFNPKRYEHNIVSAHTLHGKLSIHKLDLALEHVVRSYVLLNSHVEEESNGSLSWRPNNRYYKLEVYNDLVDQDILAKAKKPFNLNLGPLYRFILVKEGKNRNKLLIIMHHIIISNHSVHFFCNELSNFYNNKNYCSSLSTQVQISDLTSFAEKHARYLQSTVDASKAFWQYSLRNMENVDLDFLKINRRKKYKIDKSSTLSDIREKKFNFEPCTLSKLYKIKEIYSISPYTFSQIIFAILIYRYTGQSNFGISYPIKIPEAKLLVFGGNININILPYNLKSSNNIIDVIEVTSAFIKSLKSDVINHALLPIIEIISVSNSQLLDIAFSQNNLNEQKLNFIGLDSQSIFDYCIDLSNDIIFTQGIVGDQLEFRLRYFSNIVNTQLLDDFLTRYNRIFIEAIDELLEPNNSCKLKSIDEYRLLSDREYDNIIYGWNQTDIHYQLLPLPTIFEEQCRSTPNTLALIYKNKRYTYKELNIASNSLANFLKTEYIIQPEVLVSLFLERDENLIISLLAVLKSGGAYLPIDPGYPDERISYILEDSQSKIILTNDKNKLRLKQIIRSMDSKKQKFSNINIITIDSPKFTSKLSNGYIDNPINNLIISNLAYVIYTSGTTGTPKGVMVEHKGLVNFNYDLVKRYRIGANNTTEVIALFSNYVFDASVEQILLPLLNGHTLLLLPNLIWLDKDNFFEYLNYNKVTHIHSTPSFLEQFDFQKIPTLKRLIFGGEALTEETFLKIRCNKECDIISEYGLAETSVTSSVCFINSVEQTLVIGKPISNTKFYILDKTLQPLPINTIGELFIGGIGVARGYLHKDELTKERFITNPFCNQSTQYENRMYKTGDLCRLLDDGDIEFIGRNDFQVKISGYRVELHEIANILSTFDGIKQAIVLAKNINSEINKYLVGYYTSDQCLNEDLIFEFLFNNLPNYMIPRSLVHLEDFPLTINGKVDITFLKSIDVSSYYQSPTDATSIILARIWSAVLKKDNIGLYDNFFFLGGNSLLAMRATILAQEQNLNIEFHELYQSKNLISLSKLLESKKHKVQKIDCNKITVSTIPISLFQQEKWDLYIKNPKSFNVPLILALKGRVNEQALEASFNMLFEEYDILRTGYIIDIHNKGFSSIIPYKKFKLRCIRLKQQGTNEHQILNKEIENFIEQKVTIKNNLPLRHLLIQVNIDYYVLVLVLNHFSFDSISMDILFKKLCKYYNDYPSVQNKNNTMEQYGEFSSRQRQELDEQILYLNQDEFKYLFLAKKSNIVFPLASTKIDGTKVNKFIQKDILISLDKILQYTYSKFPTPTPFVLAIYFCFLFNITKLNYLSLSYLMTVRPSYREINMIGCFTHTYPISIYLSENDQSFKNILEQVNDVLIKIRKVQNIPFSYLAHKLNYPETIFQSNVTYISQNMNDESVHLKDVKINSLDYIHKNITEDFLLELFNDSKHFKLTFTFKSEFYTQLVKEVIDNIPSFVEQILNDETINISQLSRC